MPYAPIIGTLAYVLDRRRDRVLMVHRNARPDDEQFGKYNGLGGKLEADEDVVTCIRREVREEAGIDVAIVRQIDRAEIIARDGDGRIERHYVLIVFAGRLIGGELAAGDDAAEARFVPIADFARLNLTEDTRRILAGGHPL